MTDFKPSLLERARKSRKRIALPDSTDERTLRAATSLLKSGIANPVLVGKAENVFTTAAAIGLDLTGIQVIDPETLAERTSFVETYAGLRRGKGVTPEEA